MASMVFAAAAVLVVGSAGPRVATAAVPRADPTTTTIPAATATTATTTDAKTALEIRKLRQETSTFGRLLGALPVVSTGLALLGGALGLVRWQTERRKDRALRLEVGFNDNLGQLLATVTGDHPSHALARTALANLQALIRSAEPDDVPRLEQRVTDAIDSLSTVDLDFDALNRAPFERLFLEHWPGWRARLQQDPDVHRFVLYRYERALQTLHAKSPPYFETIRLAPDGQFEVKTFTDESDYLHFQNLVLAYRSHVELLTGDDRAAAVRGFQDALHNPTLADQLFAS